MNRTDRADRNRRILKLFDSGCALSRSLGASGSLTRS